MIGSLIVGMICGGIFIGLAIASHFQIIDLGDGFEDIGPLWLGFGGLGMIIGAYCGRWSVWDKRDKVLMRIKKRRTLDDLR